MKAKHEWGRADTMTDAQIHAAALADPDAQPLTPERRRREVRRAPPPAYAPVAHTSLPSVPRYKPRSQKSEHPKQLSPHSHPHAAPAATRRRAGSRILADHVFDSGAPRERAALTNIALRERHLAALIVSTKD